MNDTKQKRRFWYMRRDGVVRGPYPEKQISRYILLGRLGEQDEIRLENGDWETLQQHPHLIPEVLTLPPTEENLQKLMVARLHEDERRPRDRREDAVDAEQDRRNRRGGGERRRPESQEVVRYRALKQRVRQSRPDGGQWRLYRYPLTLAGIVLMGFLISLVMESSQPELPAPDCSGEPRAGVNWNHCNLSGIDASQASLIGALMRNSRLDGANFRQAALAGADLAYASLNAGDFRDADLSHASLIGTSARGTDFRNADLSQANLAYADLSDARLDGADLSGADLGNAIWVDKKLCLAGSVGACQRAR